MCCLCTHFIYAHRFYACYFPTYTSCFYWTFISSCCRSTSTSCFTRGMGIVKRSCIIRICALDSFSIRSWSTQLFCVIRLLMWVEKCTNYTSSSLNPFIIQSYQRSMTHPLHHVFRQLSHRTDRQSLVQVVLHMYAPKRTSECNISRILLRRNRLFLETFVAPFLSASITCMYSQTLMLAFVQLNLGHECS